MATISPSTAQIVRAERRRSRRRVSARGRERPQGLPRRAGARRRLVPPQARPCPCADGRERRRQVDADEDHRRHLHARFRLVPAQGPGNPADVAARRAAIRHRDDPSGAQPDELHDGRGEHLDSPRAAERLRLRAATTRCAGARKELFDRLDIAHRPRGRSARSLASPTARWSRSPRRCPTTPTS